MEHQPGITAPLPPSGRHLFFRLSPDAEEPVLRAALASLARAEHGTDVVVGLGTTTVARLGASIAPLHDLPALGGVGVSAPSTPMALWCWLRGDDRGELLHRGRELTRELEPAFVLAQVLDVFRYTSEGRDLSGFVDGTENPKGEAAVDAALLHDAGPGLDGSSFVAIQQWAHELGRLEAMSPEARDQVVGRRQADDVELVDAPPSAHVKRTAQESFEPAAFVLRRSQPWAEGSGAGLLFIAFGRSLAAFEAQLHRMLGLEDGITDALFRFTRPVSGMTFWCPPLLEGRLDLRALGA